MNANIKSLLIVKSVVAGAVLVLAAGVLPGISRADLVYQSDDPFGGLFGVEGFDIAAVQSAAARFVPQAEYTLDQLRLWLWNDDVLGGHPRLTITLRGDDAGGGQSRPGKTVYERWVIDLPTTGLFNPELFDFTSTLHPRLHTGQRYWVVVESDGPLEGCGVWACAQPDPGFWSLCEPPAPWTAGQIGEAGAMIVLGTPVSPVTEVEAAMTPDAGQEQSR